MVNPIASNVSPFQQGINTGDTNADGGDGRNAFAAPVALQLQKPSTKAIDAIVSAPVPEDNITIPVAEALAQAGQALAASVRVPEALANVGPRIAKAIASTPRAKVTVNPGALGDFINVEIIRPNAEPAPIGILPVTYS